MHIFSEIYSERQFSVYYLIKNVLGMKEQFENQIACISFENYSLYYDIKQRTFRNIHRLPFFLLSPKHVGYWTRD